MCCALQYVECVEKQWRESCGKTSPGNGMRLYRGENRSTSSKILETVNCESSLTLWNLEFANIAFLPGKRGTQCRIMAPGGERRKRGVQWSFRVVVPYLYPKHFPWYLAALMPQFSLSYFKNSLPCLNSHLARTLTKTPWYLKHKKVRLPEVGYSI